MQNILEGSRFFVNLKSSKVTFCLIVLLFRQNLEKPRVPHPIYYHQCVVRARHCQCVIWLAATQLLPERWHPQNARGFIFENCALSLSFFARYSTFDSTIRLLVVDFIPTGPKKSVGLAKLHGRGDATRKNRVSVTILQSLFLAQ